MVNTTYAYCECGAKIRPKDRDKTELVVGNLLFHCCSDECKKKTEMIYTNPELADDMELAFVNKPKKPME